MSMWKDVVSAQNCGVPNTATAFTQNLQQFTQKIGESKQFDQLNGPQQLQSNQRNNMTEMLQPAQINTDADQFLHRYNNKQHTALPYQRQQMPVMRQQPIDPNLMAAEFERMQVQMRQSAQHANDHTLVKQFESIYQSAPSQQWLNEYNQQSHGSTSTLKECPRGWQQQFQQQFRQQQQQQPMQQQVNSQYLPAQPMYNSMYRNQMYPPMSSQYNYMPNMMQQPNIQAQTPVKQSDDIYGNDAKSAEPLQNGTNTVESEPVVDSSTQAGVGGIDAEMMQKLMNSDDPKWRNSKFIRFINKISKGEIEFRDNQAIDKNPQSADWAQQFDETTRSKNWDAEFMASQGQQHADTLNGAGAEISTEDWARQFAGDDGEQLDGDGVDESDPLDWDDATMDAWAKEYSRDIAQEWNMKNWMGEFQQQAKQANATIDYSDPTYVFDNNTQPPANDSYERGIRLFQAGQLKEAIQMFESTVQHQPDHADAWCYLGQAQAENENENNAIAALLKAVSIDPYNLTALMMLGVSYTNDLEEHRALNYLKTWLLNNPDYQHPSIQQYKHNIQQYEQMYGSSSAAQNNSGPIVDVTLHDEVTRMFLAALQLNKNDSDLHTVLGVLYHITGDFDKAIDEFKYAIQLKPNDPQLWNKLGATQANSSRSNDAVHAYRKALELRPSYVRALANLAISYANQGMHEDAVRQYLITLKHNPDADHIWSYLRISLSHLGKDNLVDLSHNKNVELFRPYYQF